MSMCACTYICSKQYIMHLSKSFHYEQRCEDIAGVELRYIPQLTIIIIIIMMMMLLIMMIIIAFKGSIQEFLQSPHCATNRLQHVRSSGPAQSCANHMQHIERLSRATSRVACHMVRRDSSAIKFDKS